MSTSSPTPFPTNGQRQLSTQEALQRAKAMACTLAKDGLPSCSGQLFVGMFFDGTGNNMKADYETPPPEQRKHSNVVKLYQTFPLSTQKPGHYPFYLPGVGTPFPEVGDKGGVAGTAVAMGGEDRLLWALTRLLNVPHQYVYNEAQLLSDAQAKGFVFSCKQASPTVVSAFRHSLLNVWQNKLKKALNGKKPKVEQINLSVFGFSRGAAEARAFVNWLFEVCTPVGGGWTFAGIPIRLQFLGIFDTVASVGTANLWDNGILAGHNSWADHNLEIHPAVEQCVHYVSGHEIRACFPLDSVRVKASYPSNAVEVMYPGSHSDVGGGYAAKDLGVSPHPQFLLSTIPGVNMFHEARKAGVPLTAWDLLDQTFQKGLTPDPQVITDFNTYLRDAKLSAGPVEEMAQKFMGQYFSYRFKHLHSASYYATTPYASASAKDRGYLYKTQRSLFLNLAKLVDTTKARYPDTAAHWPFLKKYGAIIEGARLSWGEVSAAPSLWEQAIAAAWKALPLGYINFVVTKNVEPAFVALGHNPMQHAYAVAQSIDLDKLTPGIETFLDRYIHDSEAGFIGMGLDEYDRNGIGFVKFRTIFKGAD